MGRKSHTRTLFCSMNGFPVGELYLRNGRMSFKYAPDWLEVEGGRAISLSLPVVVYKNEHELPHQQQVSETDFYRTQEWRNLRVEVLA